jgi:organic hydroperoxide reductase OsmC/OhrA
MLTYLHMCAVNGVVVTAYRDDASGRMDETADGGGHFSEVVLRPTVTIQESNMIDKAKALHEKAHHLCFVARSVNFPVLHQPTIVVAEGDGESGIE